MNQKSEKRNPSRSVYFALFLAAITASSLQAAPPQSAVDGLTRLQNATGGQATISMDQATELASFVRFSPGSLLVRTAKGATSDEKTREFLAEHEAAFGLLDHASELIITRQGIDAHGRGQARYRQVYKGIPVFGAEFTSHFDRAGELRVISASTINIEALNTTPSWRPDDAQATARDHVARNDALRGPGNDLESINTQLLVFRSGLLKGVPGENHLAYRIEVVNDTRTVREFVFVDAHTGKVLDQITGIFEALDRKVSETSLGNIVWEDSVPDPEPIPAGWAGGTVQQVTDWQNEIDGAKETYNLMASITAGAWLSYDGADKTMLTVNNDPGIACPNANWNGTSANYCSNVTADDIVAHEWGHAYTEYTADLIYQWQTGALNESYSDVWGEVVDFLNGRGTDSPSGLRTDGSCSVYGGGPSVDDTYRWLMGEDASAFGGAIRDMWNPNCASDPGKVTDTQYWCSTGDNGGVHINSGVPNHSFALMVDGGIYNGQTITGLDLTKATHIFWDALQMLTPVSNFVDQADALEASCDGLVGFDLPALSTSVTDAGPSSIIIDAEDCDEVALVVAAVELRTNPEQCGFEPMLDNDPPPRCLDNGDLRSVSLEDWESGIGSWTAATHDVVNPPTFTTPDWAVVSDLPDERAGSAAFVANVRSGDCEVNDESGALNLDSPEIAIPAGTLIPRLSIDHWVATELGWDGGNLKISVNGGAFELVPVSAFDISPYSNTLIASGNTNPLAGQDAFTGADGGSARGSWGQSQVDLTGIAGAGDNVILRFDFGLDGCSGVLGWYVDEVELYSCSLETPCGNSVLDLDEQCDDGNMVAGDGCSSSCQIEDGWQCTDPFAATPVPDHSFEAGPFGGTWTESSTNFGTPICDVADCGTGTGTGPSNGVFWAWFGGFAGIEDSSVSQSFTIPASVTTLKFDFEIPLCDSPADYLKVLIDGNEELAIDGTDPACGVIGYMVKTVDISAYADGAAHTLEFYSQVFGTNGTGSNFFVDNIVLPGSASQCTNDESLIFADGFED